MTYADNVYDDDLDYEPEDQPVITYKVVTRSYCGMRFEHDEVEDFEEALDVVYKRIAYVEKLGATVDKLSDTTWEICEPEDCAMVPDFCGVLMIKEIVK